MTHDNRHNINPHSLTEPSHDHRQLSDGFILERCFTKPSPSSASSICDSFTVIVHSPPYFLPSYSTSSKMDDFSVNNEEKHPYQRFPNNPISSHPPSHPAIPSLIIPPPSSSSSISPPLPLPPSLSPPSHHDEHPVIPIADPGSGAHDNCSATCILSHPKRSATIFLVSMFSIVAFTTLLLILVKAVRGDEPINPDHLTSTVIQLPANNLTTIPPPLTTTHYKSTVGLSAHDLLHTLESTLAHSPTFHTLASVTPKVPDDGDMVSAMIMLMWGLSPLLSAVCTISWTYYTYRDKDEGLIGSEEVHSHHHHPMLVNPSPPLSSDEEGTNFQLYPPSVGSGSPATRRTSPAHVSPQAVVVSPPQPVLPPVLPPSTRTVRSQTAVLSSSSLVRRNVSPSPPAEPSPQSGPVLPSSSFPSRALTAPSAPPSHVEAALTRSKCRRVHTVHPFYSRRSPVRPRWWFIPTTRDQCTTLWVPFRKFLIRCYFLPILIPTLAAVTQYVLAGSIGCTGWLSSAFVPTLTEALSFPSTVVGEVWAVILSFFYELLFGCWWDPFPPGSADWGKGMNFHGASWLALSAMEEIGWAGLLFPCLYELYPGNPTKASLITGVLWSAWHWPFLLFGQLGWLPDSAAYHPGLLSTPFLYGFLTFTLSTTFSRVIMVRLLFWSDDLWSQCVYHAAHNVMVFNFFAQLPEVREDEFPYAGLFIAEAGIPVVTIYMAVAGWTIKGWYDREYMERLEGEIRSAGERLRMGSGGGIEMEDGGEEVGVGSPVGLRRDFPPQMSPIQEGGEGLMSPEQERKEGEDKKKVRWRGGPAEELHTPLL